jgi:hypothetical protein
MADPRLAVVRVALVAFVGGFGAWGLSQQGRETRRKDEELAALRRRLHRAEADLRRGRLAERHDGAGTERAEPSPGRTPDGGQADRSGGPRPRTSPASQLSAHPVRTASRVSQGKSQHPLLEHRAQRVRHPWRAAFSGPQHLRA